MQLKQLLQECCAQFQMTPCVCLIFHWPGTLLLNLLTANVLRRERKCTLPSPPVYVVKCLPMVICIAYWHYPPNKVLKFHWDWGSSKILTAWAASCWLKKSVLGFLHLHFSWTVKGSITFPVCFLHVLSEALSVKKSSEIATAFKEDGLVGDTINNFGRPAQERDFFRWTLVWPCWYVASLSVRHHVAMCILTCARIRLPIKPYTATKLGSLHFFVWMKVFAILTLVLPFDSQGFPFLAQWDWRRKRPCAKCPSFCHLTYSPTSWVKMTLWPRTVYLKMDLMQLGTIGAKKCQVTRQDSVYRMKT